MTTKEQIRAIIQQYADKGKRLYAESYNEKKEKYAIGFWDGYKSCADGLLRELEDIQEEPVSEDLGKSTSKIILEGTNFNKSWFARPELAFTAGAEWQKEQIIKRLKSNEII